MTVDVEPGDNVAVEDLTGEESLAVVVAIPDVVASECLLFEDGPKDKYLSPYWGDDVADDEPVVTVRYLYECDDGSHQAGRKEYDFPASKVSRVSDDPVADDDHVEAP